VAEGTLGRTERGASPGGSDMTEGPERRAERRLVERCPVQEAAFIRSVAARNQPRPPAHPATIIDVSVKGAGLRTSSDIELRPGWTVELGVDETWSRCRIIWSRPDLGGGQVAGVEFTNALHGFLPALQGWIERRDALAAAR
jgi:PilZ domain-containing protein